MLDADGATKVTDLEKLENQVISGCMPSIANIPFLMTIGMVRVDHRPPDFFPVRFT